MYVGKYIQSVSIGEDFYNVQTSNFIFRIKENPEIPDSAWCYMRIEPPRWDLHPDIAIQMTVTYLTWIGAEKEYRIYSDVKKLLR